MNTYRDELLFELQDTKKSFVDVNLKMLRLQSDNIRWEKELGKQQLRIDKLLQMIAQGPSDAKAGPHRKDGDKNQLIRQLKLQILSLRDNVASRDAEIEALNKGQKATHLLELITEKDEYYNEITRLQKVAKELKDELAVIKQRQEWSSNMITPDDMDIRSEFLKLATNGGFGMTIGDSNAQKPQRPSSGGKKRPSSAKGSSQQQQYQHQQSDQNWQQDRHQIHASHREEQQSGKYNSSKFGSSNLDQESSQRQNEEVSYISLLN